MFRRCFAKTRSILRRRRVLAPSPPFTVQVGSDVTVLVAGADADAVVAEAGSTAGVGRVLYANTDLPGFVAESVAPIVR